MWALFESPLGHYLCQAWGPWPNTAPNTNPYHMQLNMFVKFVENNSPVNQQEVEGSLSQYLCMW